MARVTLEINDRQQTVGAAPEMPLLWDRPAWLHRLRGGIDGEGNLVGWTDRIADTTIIGQRDPKQAQAYELGHSMRGLKSLGENTLRENQRPGDTGSHADSKARTHHWG